MRFYPATRGASTCWDFGSPGSCFRHTIVHFRMFSTTILLLEVMMMASSPGVISLPNYVVGTMGCELNKEAFSEFSNLGCARLNRHSYL
jgi:hypothetical protein